MKKNQFRKECEDVLFRAGIGWEKRESRLQVLEKFEDRISGKRGVEDARDRFFENLKRMYPPVQQTYFRNHTSRLQNWKRKMAETLAKKAGANYDEHGYARGDYRTTYGLDYVGPWESAKAPYWDMGGEGLGLVRVDRTRVYAKNSKWRPSSVSTYFLVGRNEAGTYFSHPVGQNCRTVEDAVQWIWGGKAYHIIQRQGDIALIRGNGGPKMPPYLPWGHKIHGDRIVHAFHPDLPVPKNPGERIIVGRRAAERAIAATRD